MINDGVFFDTVACTSIRPPVTQTHHEEFCTFFKEETGLDFPSSQVLNPVLKQMSKAGLAAYESAVSRLKQMREEGSLPEDGYAFVDGMEHALMILRDAEAGEAVRDLPEVIQSEMPSTMRHYADLTYNAEDLTNADRVIEITGIYIPDEARIDKLFERLGFDRARMEALCRRFSDVLSVKKIFDTSRREQPLP